LGLEELLLDPAAWDQLTRELWETFGFAPCLVVLGALLLRPRLWGRPHWRMLALIWIGLWVAVMFWLMDRTRGQARIGYLDGRHTLVLLVMLHALFALALPIWAAPMRWWQDWWRQRLAGGAYWTRLPAWMRWRNWPMVFSGAALLLACLPGVIMLSEPPGRDRMFVRRAAEYLQSHVPAHTVVADTDGLVAFYAGLDYQPWQGGPERPLLEPLEELARARPVVLVLVYQGHTEPADHLGGWWRTAEFHAVGARHDDVLVVYEMPGEWALPRGAR
jgi:hypothetical protein